MASEQPYNELGQILSEGGEIALGLAILQDLGEEGFLLFFTKRFAPIRDEDRDALMQLSQAMIDAGVIIHQKQLEDFITPGEIPLNEFLFGGDLQGRRVLFTGEVELPGADRRIQLRIPFPDVPTVEALREAFMTRGIDIASRYPEKFGLSPGDIPAAGSVYLLLPERAW